MAAPKASGPRGEDGRAKAPLDVLHDEPALEAEMGPIECRYPTAGAADLMKAFGRGISLRLFGNPSRALANLVAAMMREAAGAVVIDVSVGSHVPCYDFVDCLMKCFAAMGMGDRVERTGTLLVEMKSSGASCVTCRVDPDGPVLTCPDAHISFLLCAGRDGALARSVATRPDGVVGRSVARPTFGLDCTADDAYQRRLAEADPPPPANERLMLSTLKLTTIAVVFNETDGVS